MPRPMSRPTRSIAAPILLALLVSPALGASPQPVAGDKGMVVTDQAIASAVGAEILRKGGNAIDAAVAVGYAQAVVNPCCGNLGGGGFMTLRLADGTTRFVDFREKAPLAASANMYLDDKGNVIAGASLNGWKAVGVPGSVMGLDTVLAKWGTMSRAEVMAPAIRLAKDGFTLVHVALDILSCSTKAFQASPEAAPIFLDAGKPFQVGATFRQTDLAATLQAISDKGPDAFYKSDLTDRMVAASKAGGGLLSRQDFETYSVRVMDPVGCSYRGYEVVSAAPPSSGGIALCEILNILEGYPLGYLGWNSADMVALSTEAERHAFLDRNSALGDPDFVKNPVERLTSKAYAAKIRAVINRDKATPSAELKPSTPPHEGTQTTHYSVIDKAGNAVAVTYSLNSYFGAKVMAPGTGVFMNNTMDDFTVKVGAANLFGLVQGASNGIEPGKRPLSSMTPTILVKDGKPFMVLGSPGGSRIITSVVQVIVNVVDFGMSISEAVNAPRLHHQWMPDVVYAEPYALSADTQRSLAGRGYQIVVQRPWSAVEAILIGQKDGATMSLPSFGDDVLRTPGVIPGRAYGANDSRRPAGAAVAE